MNRPECTVAIDGSLFKFHPRLKSLMEMYSLLIWLNYYNILIIYSLAGISQKWLQLTRYYQLHSIKMFKLKINLLLKYQFKLMLAEDGSGKGAGLVAAIARRLKQKN